jgi:hypothetical protein
MNLLINLLILAAAYVVPWLLGGFIALTLDVTEWTEFGRTMVAAIGTVFLMGALGCRSSDGMK